jgi:DNA invertase Pin-like site-specific DNA recombinase
MKYILYCRKSTDTEDRQVLSLDSQERELLDIAKRHNLSVVKVLRESMSAKSAGRPIFDQMMKMIDSGKADAILCWKLDRLARNFVDGGKVIDNLQKSVIKEIRTYEAAHIPSDNVLLLAVQLGMANQYIRDLSVNVKRGNREKLSRGEWPNHAPFGYLNDKATKTITIDPIRSKYVPRAFDLYITGSHGFQDISDILYAEGLRTRSGGKVLKSHVQRILGSVFYTGLMERDGKYYNGNHQPLVSKDIFDQAQDVMHYRIHPKPQHLFFPLRGFLTCETCGCALTASLKKGHQYYYCTNGKQKCDEHKGYMRETYLYEKVSNLFEMLDFSERKIEIMYQAAKEMCEQNDTYAESVLTALHTRLDALKTKETRLLDTFLAEQITKDIYDAKVLEIHNKRVSLNRQIGETEANGTKGASTLEPVKKIFLQGSRAKKDFLKADDFKKREILENLLWNLSIKNKSVASIKFRSPFEILAKAPKDASISMLLGPQSVLCWQH